MPPTFKKKNNFWLLLGGLNGHFMPCSSCGSSCGSSFGSASKNSFCMKRSNLPVHSSVDNELQHIFPLKLRQSWRLMLSSWLLVQEKEGEETSTSEAELESWKLFENFQGLNKEEIRCHKLLKLPASGINNFKKRVLRRAVILLRSDRGRGPEFESLGAKQNMHHIVCVYSWLTIMVSWVSLRPSIGIVHEPLIGSDCRALY